ncbi:hypothetical protein DYGSA30_26450 [Dyella sp. GSA-30]|nr:hypothetical protein DYGSA30_26450 [Dyella sp. GSA-30]
MGGCHEITTQWPQRREPVNYPRPFCPNKVREAYTHAAQYLDERKRMMQAWADYLDGLRAGSRIVAIKRDRA